MNFNIIQDIKTAYSNLNPGEVRNLADRSISVGLIAANDAGFAAMESFLAPAALVYGDLIPVAALHRIRNAQVPANLDFVLLGEGLAGPRDAFVFHPLDTKRTVDAILDARPNSELTLARHFKAFRGPAIDRIINRVSRENAFFSIATALPNVIPNFLELPWAVGEFATDTAFLTINQIRMAFLLAACYGKPIGYVEQKMELATIVAGAFGWRAIARELVGKIPLGGGLIPKAAVAFAGSYVVGRGLDQLHSNGGRLNRQERRKTYEVALQKGKAVVTDLVASIRKRNAA